MSYTRVIGTYVVTGLNWRERRFSAGVDTPWDSYTGIAGQTFNCTKSGSSNPQWRKQVKSGNSAGTGYSVAGLKVLKSTMGNVIFKYSSGSGSGKVTVTETLTGFNFPHVTPTSYLSSFSKADNDALMKVYRKIEQTANHWKGLKFFAEFGSVVHQFGHPAQAILKYTKEFCDRKYIYLDTAAKNLRGSKKAKAKLQKMVADSYLEYVFGLAPLISDAEKAAEALARFNYEGDPTNNPALRERAVGRGSESYVVPDSFTIVGAPKTSKLYTNNIIRQKTEMRVQYIVGLSTAARADFGSLSHFAKLGGFTVAKVPAAVWEAVPFSWVVDYFTNVQGVLDSVGTDTSSVKWINKTTIRLDTYEVIAQVNAKASKDQIAAYGYRFESLVGNELGHWKVQKTTMDRTVPSTLGWPSFEVSLPIGDEHLGKKLTNLMAVAAKSHTKLVGLLAGFAIASSTLL